MGERANGLRGVRSAFAANVGACGHACGDSRKSTENLRLASTLVFPKIGL